MNKDQQGSIVLIHSLQETVILAPYEKTADVPQFGNRSCVCTAYPF
jgi:hypothetical protein